MRTFSGGRCGVWCVVIILWVKWTSGHTGVFSDSVDSCWGQDGSLWVLIAMGCEGLWVRIVWLCCLGYVFGRGLFVCGVSCWLLGIVCVCVGLARC